MPPISRLRLAFLSRSRLMAEQQPSRGPSGSDLVDRLHEIARLLQTADHLGPEAQQALARLSEDLSNALDPSASPSPEEAELVHSTGRVVEALHNAHDAGPLEAARERLENAAAALEARAPTVAGVARRLLDTLSNLGI